MRPGQPARPLVYSPYYLQLTFWIKGTRRARCSFRKRDALAFPILNTTV